jgi:prepilin-type processing-associated H-X9-DG protein/prepilin-type N-terminal cleavage/methylation domain-containing protein
MNRLRPLAARTRSFGFTLAELLVVIAVIAMLLAIVAPTVGRLPAWARRVKCASNEKHLFDAYSLRLNDTTIGTRPDFAVDTWVAELEPYFSHNGAVLLCSEVETVTPTIPIVRMFVWGSGGATRSDYFIELTNTYPWWAEMDCNEVQPPPGIWKVPEATLYTGGYHGESFGIEGFRGGHNNTDVLKRYRPGRRSNIYWYVLETARYGEDLTAGGDLDYDDVVVRVTEDIASRRLIMEPIQIWSGQDYNLVGADGTWWPSGTKSINDNRDRSVGAPGTKGPYIFPMNATSYGMSRYAPHINPGQDKVLLLDYNQDIVNAAPGDPIDDGWDMLNAPRHLGKSNVLFADGSVQLMAPDDIDPDISSDRDTYWAP